MRKNGLCIGIMVVLGLSVSGCEDSTVQPLAIPTATLAAPVFAAGTNALNSSALTTSSLTIAHAVSTTLTAGSGTSNASPAGLLVSRVGTAACSNITIQNPSKEGATIIISGCTGNGSIAVQAEADIAVSATASSKASNIISIPVDNTPPTTTSFAATNAVVGTSDGANSVTVSFSEKVQALSADNSGDEFTITSSGPGCSVDPEAAVVTTDDGAGHSIAVATLSNGVCAEGATVNVSLNLNKIKDLATNLGLSGANPTPVSYNVTSSPVATLSSTVYPTGLSALNTNEVANIAVTFNNTVSTTLVAATGTSAAPPAGLTVTASGNAACDIELGTVTLTGTAIQIRSCTGDGVLSIKVAANVLTSGTAAHNIASNIMTVNVDNTEATATLAVADATANVSGANTVTATFSELVQNLSANNSGGEFVVSGCSTQDPSVSVTMSNDGSGHSIATATLSGGVCANLETVTVSLDMTKVADKAGNAGSASPTPVTYGIDDTLP